MKQHESQFDPNSSARGGPAMGRTSSVPSRRRALTGPSRRSWGRPESTSAPLGARPVSRVIRAL
jgi:hypothetical protein